MPATTLHRLGGPTMGTSWSAHVIASEADLPAVRAAVVGELDLVNREMSTWAADSDLSRYNTAPADTWVTLPEACRFVLGRALTHAAASGGAFDPSVGPSVNLWGFGPVSAAGSFGAVHSPPHLPDPVRVGASQARVDWRRVRLAGETAYQPGGCYLDLSAIAKGYAADRALAALVDLGVEHALIEVGGELKACGRRPDGSPWRVAVHWPGYDDGEGPVVALNDLAIATSGDDFRYFEAGGRRYSHTLDPRTGCPVSHALTSVTVLHTAAIEADALATALLVLGPDAGVAVARRQGLAALFVLRDADGHVAHPTPGFLEALL